MFEKRAKIFTVSLLTLLIVLVISLFGSCSYSVIKGTNSLVDEKKLESDESSIFENHKINKNYTILVEKSTGVCYLQYTSGFYENRYGITIMLNADGSPKIWDESMIKEFNNQKSTD